MSLLSEPLKREVKSSLASWLLEVVLTEVWKDNPLLRTPLIRYAVKFIVGAVISILLERTDFLKLDSIRLAAERKLPNNLV